MQVLRKARIIVATAALVCAIAIAGTVQRAAAAGDDVSPTDQYKVYCAKCHGPSGHGDGANASTLKTRPRDFSDCATMAKISDDTMFKAIKDGGAAVGVSGDMPAWGAGLSDDDIHSAMKDIKHFCAK